MLQTCNIDKREIYDIPLTMSAHNAHLEYSYAASEVSAFGIQAKIRTNYDLVKGVTDIIF